VTSGSTTKYIYTNTHYQIYTRWVQPQ